MDAACAAHGCARLGTVSTAAGCCQLATAHHAWIQTVTDMLLHHVLLSFFSPKKVKSCPLHGLGSRCGQSRPRKSPVSCVRAVQGFSLCGSATLGFQGSILHVKERL